MSGPKFTPSRVTFAANSALVANKLDAAFTIGLVVGSFGTVFSCITVDVMVQVLDHVFGQRKRRH